MIMHPLNFSTPYSLDNFVIEIFLHLYYQETFMGENWKYMSYGDKNI